MNKKRNNQQLDAKDRKIIKELFGNGRATYSEIAKKVRLSKEVVNYRIKELMKSGLITEFNSVIDVKKLGWQIFMVYIRLRNIDIEEEQSIIDNIKNNENVAWLVKCIGNYDFVVKFFAKSSEHVNSLMKLVEEKLKDNLEEYFVDYLIEENAVPQSFIYTSEPTREVYFAKSGETIRLQEVDYKILKLLEHNARIPISEMSASLNAQRDTVNYHLKNLEKSKIILKYRPSFWPQKLGYNWYFIILKVSNLNQSFQSKLLSYIIRHPNVTYFYRTAGTSDLQIEVRMKTSEELNTMLMELRGILKASLKRHEILVILEEHKYTYFPDCIAKD